MSNINGKENKKRDTPSTSEHRTLFQRLRQGLSKTRHTLAGRLDRLFLGKKEITEDLLEELEEILFTSDIGVTTTDELIDLLKEKLNRKELKEPAIIKNVLRDHILSFVKTPSLKHALPAHGEPLVIMVIGVNGVGKTTLLARLPTVLSCREKMSCLSQPTRSGRRLLSN